MTDTNRIAVEPAAAAYVGVIKHPIDGPLKATGSLWTNDGFTCRMLVDGVIVKAVDRASPGSAVAPPAKPDEAEASAG